ncbi:MAG: hypothetical protein KDD45_10380, partial [Bdellovibrionales bacterium]|nr:hypothetical protein [Bdellovibrionales bacterium]
MKDINLSVSLFFGRKLTMIFCKWSDFSNRLNLLVLTFILFITSGCFLKANISDLSIGTTASIDGGSDKIQLKPSSESLILNETDVDYIDSTSLNLSIDKSFKTDISIQLTLVDIYATQELDYKISPLSIIIPAGATKVNIPIKIIGDSIGEGEETFKILLNLDSQDINLTTTEVLVTIVDNDPITLQVNSLYPVNGTNFFDYVENISTSPLSSIADAVCSYNPSGSNSYDKCLNGGYYRKIQAIGQHSCANLTLSDGLDVFDWKCTDSADPVYFYSSGLKKGKGLKDILNSSSFKNNSVVLKKDGVTVASSNSTTWWSNPVTPIALNPNSGDPRISLTTSGTIYTSTGGNSAGVDISGSRLGFVVISGT